MLPGYIDEDSEEIEKENDGVDHIERSLACDAVEDLDDNMGNYPAWPIKIKILSALQRIAYWLDGVVSSVNKIVPIICE